MSLETGLGDSFRVSLVEWRQAEAPRRIRLELGDPVRVD